MPVWESFEANEYLIFIDLVDINFYAMQLTLLLILPDKVLTKFWKWLVIVSSTNIRKKLFVEPY